MPSIWQAFVERPARVKPGIDFDRKLYVARRVFEQSSQDTYVCSLSSRTIVYKGMFLVKELRLFYPDLQSEDYESAIGMVHSRFLPTRHPVGTAPTPTALSCIMARSTPSAATWIPCWPARKPLVPTT